MQMDEMAKENGQPIWLSSFAVKSTATAPPRQMISTSSSTRSCDPLVPVVDVRAVVWGSSASTLEHVPASAFTTRTAPHGDMDTQFTVATTSITLLRRLRVVSGAYVVVSTARAQRHHIARLVLARSPSPLPSDVNDAQTPLPMDATDEVALTPLLAFNLGIPLHSARGSQGSTAFVALRVAHAREMGLASLHGDSSGGPPFRRLHEQTPAIAHKAVIAPLLVSSLACRDHAALQHPDGIVRALRRHFATPRVLQRGDVLAVSLCEQFPLIESEAEEESSVASTSSRISKAYSKSVIPQYMMASTTVATDEEQCSAEVVVVTSPALTVDSSLVFFRVESLDDDDGRHMSEGEGGDLSVSARRVSSDSELLQTGAISAAAPDETLVHRFLSGQQESSGASRSKLPFVSPTLETLMEMLHPSQLCSVPVSVLLSGPRGVGKTTLVRDAAAQLGLAVVEISFTELTAASEVGLLQNLREQVAKAQALAPCVLYISHMFAVDKDDDEAQQRLAAALSTALSTLSETGVSVSNSIPLVACVDDVSEVPKFVRQCFLYELPVDAPDQKARLALLTHLMHDMPLTYDGLGDGTGDRTTLLKELARRTAGRTCGELSALLTDAGMLAIERIRSSDNSEDLLARLVKSATNPLSKADDVSTEAVAISWYDLDEALQRQQARGSSSSSGAAASIPNVKWDDVGGLEDVKDEILDVVQLPLKHPELFASGVRQRSGILLYGPPGTGKTLLAKAIATECNLNFLSVKGPELLNMYIGESEKNVREVFARARRSRPCILFFDELDSLAPMRGRGSDSGGVMDRVVSQLLTEIDGLSSSSNSNSSKGESSDSSSSDHVFVIGATNRPDLLESGLLRPGRLDRLLYLGICTERAAQLKVVRALTRKFTLHSDVILEDVVENCPLTFTGADFYALCSGALSAALKDKVSVLEQRLASENAVAECYDSPSTATVETPATLTMRVLLNRMSTAELAVEVQQRHFEDALANVVPSVSPAELRHYEALKEQYSSKQ